MSGPTPICQLIKLPALSIKTTQVGDVAEFLFDAQAVERGYIVTRPIHSGTVYDRVIDNGERFFRVQIKAIWNASKVSNSYRAYFRRSKKIGYKSNEVDVFAVYVKPLNCWYLLPSSGALSAFLKQEYAENWKIFETDKSHIQET